MTPRPSTASVRHIASSRITLLWCMAFLAPCPTLPGAEPASSLPVLETSRRIWDEAPHNAFTDLIRHGDQWLCVFREGKGHVSPDGAIRVIASPDGQVWKSKARLTHPQADLRDPKITLAPNGDLFLTGAAAWHQPNPARHLTLAWRSKDGISWGEPVAIGDTNIWLWRVTAHHQTLWSVGYGTAGNKLTRLYRCDEGGTFEPWVPTLFDMGYPNETGLHVLPDETMFCLLRRDEAPHTGLLGRSRPPYRDWTWTDLGMRIGGPNFLVLPDGRAHAVVRFYDGKVRTSLCALDLQKGTLTEQLALPSGGDTSYAGMAWHGERLWISYYSSHEGKTAIYLAVVRL